MIRTFFAIAALSTVIALGACAVYEPAPVYPRPAYPAYGYAYPAYPVYPAYGAVVVEGGYRHHHWR